MEKLKTATGKVFDSDYLAVITTPAQAYIRILNVPLAEVATVFSNPAETVQIWHGDHYLSYYTRLVAIVPEPSAVKVVLSKE